MVVLSALLRDHELQTTSAMSAISTIEALDEYTRASIVKDAETGAMIRKTYYTNDVQISDDDAGGDSNASYSSGSDDDSGYETYSSDEESTKKDGGHDGHDSSSGRSSTHSSTRSSTRSSTSYLGHCPGARMFVNECLLKFNRMIFDFIETSARIQLACPSLYYDIDPGQHLWWTRRPYTIKSIEYRDTNVIVVTTPTKNKDASAPAALTFIFVRNTEEWTHVYINDTKYTVTDIGALPDTTVCASNADDTNGSSSDDEYITDSDSD